MTRTKEVSFLLMWGPIEQELRILKDLFRLIESEVRLQNFMIIWIYLLYYATFSFFLYMFIC